MCKATMKNHPRIEIVSLVTEIVIMADWNYNFTVLGITEGFSLRVSNGFAATFQLGDYHRTWTPITVGTKFAH
jgi:hypothetical protein